MINANPPITPFKSVLITVTDERKFVGETKGLDLSKVTGKEWDKKDVKNESTNI